MYTFLLLFNSAADCKHSIIFIFCLKFHNCNKLITIALKRASEENASPSWERLQWWIFVLSDYQQVHYHWHTARLMDTRKYHLFTQLLPKCTLEMIIVCDISDKIPDRERQRKKEIIRVTEIGIDEVRRSIRKRSQWVCCFIAWF